MEIYSNPFALDVAIAFHEIMLKTNFNIAYLSIQNCNFPKTISIVFNTDAHYNRYDKRSENCVDIIDLYDAVGNVYSLQDEGDCQELE
ncbi:Hypothetical protein CINCED_3A025843 [Cinara cedri]|uniref:Uncharacterized protein n=1 Tax=Cinara cedri TaxID=506608 RepID=A0A5E4M127_9HEMI|nr:Hypothetical protein CINCED_3A025843 [Cinara cedri]